MLIIFFFDLLQSIPAAIHFEFKDVQIVFEFDCQVDSALAGNIFSGNIQSQAGQVGIDNTGKIAFIAADGIVDVIVVGNGGKKSLAANIN